MRVPKNAPPPPPYTAITYTTRRLEDTIPGEVIIVHSSGSVHRITSAPPAHLSAELPGGSMELLQKLSQDAALRALSTTKGEKTQHTLEVFDNGTRWSLEIGEQIPKEASELIQQIESLGALANKPSNAALDFDSFNIATLDTDKRESVSLRISKDGALLLSRNSVPESAGVASAAQLVGVGGYAIQINRR